MEKNWTIIEFERGRHTAIPNSLCRYGIACVIPMISEYNPKAKIDIAKPALQTIAFIPAEETKVRFALDNIRYVEKVWRHIDGRRAETGELVTVPDGHLQHFLDGLAKREKRPAKARKTMNLGAEAESDWFGLYVQLYGLQAAIKRFGRDMREKIAA